MSTEISTSRTLIQRIFFQVFLILKRRALRCQSMSMFKSNYAWLGCSNFSTDKLSYGDYFGSSLFRLQMHLNNYPGAVSLASLYNFRQLLLQEQESLSKKVSCMISVLINLCSCSPIVSCRSIGCHHESYKIFKNLFIGTSLCKINHPPLKALLGKKKDSSKRPLSTMKTIFFLQKFGDYQSY